MQCKYDIHVRNTIAPICARSTAPCCGVLPPVNGEPTLHRKVNPSNRSNKHIQAPNVYQSPSYPFNSNINSNLSLSCFFAHSLYINFTG